MANYKTFDEEYSLIEQLRDNDDAYAFKMLFMHYKERLFLFALKLVKNKDLAEEVVHEVFCKIWENRKKLNTDLSFNAYIHTICKHQIYKMLKKAARYEGMRHEILETMQYANNDTEDTCTFNEYHLIANKAINGLPPRRKVVYNICKVEGKSYEEAALELGISKNAVKDHIVKATKAIREVVRVGTGIII